MLKFKSWLWNNHRKAHNILFNITTPKQLQEFKQSTMENNITFDLYIRDLTNGCLIGAFYWTETRQGHDYWSHINTEWLIALDEYISKADQISRPEHTNKC